MAASEKIRALCLRRHRLDERILALGLRLIDVKAELESALRAALPGDLRAFAEECGGLSAALSSWGDASFSYSYGDHAFYGGGRNARDVRQRLKRLQAAWPIEFTTESKKDAIRIFVKLKGDAK